MQRTLLSTSIAAALLLATSANAQSVDTSEWVCEFCPFDDGHRADYEVGATNADEDSAWFGNATGYDEEGTYANLDGDGSYAGENHRLRWTVEDLALDSRYAALDGGKPGSYDYNIAWRELPRRQYITTSTIFTQPTGDSLGLPSGWVRAPLTTGFTQLDSSLTSRAIESDRSFLDIGGSVHAFDGLDISADYRRQTNDGVKIYGGPAFTNASLLPMPFDYVTDEVDIGARYALGDGFVALNWYLSDFDNQNASLSWATPFTTALGAETPSMAQAPDNQFSQIRLSGGYSFPAIRTSVSASVAMGEVEQTEALLPYTTNPNLMPGALPRSSLDGSVDTTNYALSVNSRPFPKARIKLSYRYDERDNKTDVDLWERVIADTFLSGDPEANIPYSFERSVLKVSGDYDLFSTLRLSAGYERRDMDRNLQEVAEQTEDTGWGRVRWRPLSIVEIDGRAGTSKRDIDSYNEVFATTFGQNPLMRKYNLAYRYREFAEVAVTLAPADSPLSLTIDGRVADDSYTRSQLGLISGKETYYGADVGWTITERAALYVNLGTEAIESEQRGSEAFATPDWRALNDDDFDYFGAGFRIRQIGEKADLSIDYTRSEGSASIVVDAASGPPSQFPDLDTTLDHLRLRLDYRQSERLELNATLTFQSFETEDWSLEGVTPAAIPSILSLGARPYDDEQLLFGLGFQYRLGQDSVPAP